MALGILGVALIVGEKGVALIVGETAASHLTPLHAPVLETRLFNKCLSYFV